MNWVYLKDSAPNKDGNYLVYDSFFGYLVCRYFKRHSNWTFMLDHTRPLTPIYWAEIPEINKSKT